MNRTLAALVLTLAATSASAWDYIAAPRPYDFNRELAIQSQQLQQQRQQMIMEEQLQAQRRQNELIEEQTRMQQQQYQLQNCTWCAK